MHFEPHVLSTAQREEELICRKTALSAPELRRFGPPINGRTPKYRLAKIYRTFLDGDMFPYIRNAAEVPWQPGPYEGVDLAVLHKNPATGGLTVLRRFRAGTSVPAHTHPDANESVYVLSGEWIEEGVTHGPGSFFFVPRGQKHGPHFAKSEVISVTMFDGPLTIA